MRTMIAAAALCILGCAPLQPSLDGSVAEDALRDAGTCAMPSSPCGQLNGQPGVELIAGYWVRAPLGSVGAISMGLTDLSVDVCEAFRTLELPREAHYSLGLVVYEDERDEDGNGLPDVGTYPVDTTFDQRPELVRGTEVMAGFESGNGGLAEWETGPVSGHVELTMVSATEVRGVVSIDFGHGDRLDGPFQFSYCSR